MLRTFNQHILRRTTSLNGRWDFVTEHSVQNSKKIPAHYPRAIYVPSVWESLPGLETFRGNAWYRTQIAGHPDCAIRLLFGGVSHTATVYLDGKKIGGHYDAFTPWSVITPPKPKSACELVVAVDNSFGRHSALHLPNDYYTYGGITRPVEVQYVPETYIDNVYATPEKTKKGWNLEIRVVLKNWSRKSYTRQLSALLGDNEWTIGKVTVPARGTRQITRIFENLDMIPWSPAQPHLYGLMTMLWDGDDVVDDYIDRIGFREIKVAGNNILFNGKPIRLRGYNRHEDHPQFGCAIPFEQIVADLNIMSDLGCNFVRTCHYPNDMRFLDLCDEMGFYVWEESHARTVDFRHPKFAEQIENSTREMIASHYNHPSIIIWGCLNECESETAFGRKHHKRVMELIRSLDSSRPVTFAENRGKNDICFGLADIASLNVYTGWYGSNISGTRKAIDSLIAWLSSKKSNGGSGKPIIISEFGAGAIPGNHHSGRVHWSEEYQADVLDEALRVYLNHPKISGACIWQFADCRVTEDNGYWMRRPRAMNNKGTVDEYRRPKLAYEVVKKHMHEAWKHWG